MSQEDQNFLVQRNIERFSRLLKAERDAERRSTLKQLLREEREKRDGFSSESDSYLRD